MKLLSFEGGVPVQAGLPLPVATPAHGTAYDSVGKDLASVTSTQNALDIAMTMAKRKLEKEDRTVVCRSQDCGYSGATSHHSGSLKVLLKCNACAEVQVLCRRILKELFRSRRADFLQSLCSAKCLVPLLCCLTATPFLDSPTSTGRVHQGAGIRRCRTTTQERVRLHQLPRCADHQSLKLSYRRIWASISIDSWMACRHFRLWLGPRTDRAIYMQHSIDSNLIYAVSCASSSNATELTDT